jgi:hypothetical protein
MQRSKKTTGRGAYFKGQTLHPGLPGNPAAFPDDELVQAMPKDASWLDTIKRYQATGVTNWEAFAAEEMSTLLRIPGYKYVPVPKAWDGVLVPSNDGVYLDGNARVTDIIYADVKKTARGGPVTLKGPNQKDGAENMPVRIIHFVWPKPKKGKASHPAAVILKSGPKRSTRASARLMLASTTTEARQNAFASGYKKRKIDAT